MPYQNRSWGNNQHILVVSEICTSITGASLLINVTWLLYSSASDPKNGRSSMLARSDILRSFISRSKRFVETIMRTYMPQVLKAPRGYSHNESNGTVNVFGGQRHTC